MKSWNLDKRSNAHHRLSELSSDVLLSHKWFSCCGAWPGRSDANEKKTEAHLGSESQTRGRSPVLCILIHLPGDCGAGYVKTIALHPCTHAGLLTVHTSTGSHARNIVRKCEHHFRSTGKETSTTFWFS